jgi:hypothetical protein
MWYADPLLGNNHEIISYTRAVAPQWFSSDHMDIPTDVTATIKPQQRNVFYAVRAELSS